MQKVNITDMEKDVLVNGLYGSEFNDHTIEYIEENGGYGDYFNGLFISVWSNCVIDCCKIVKSNQVSGVISSLVQKGLVDSEGEGKDSAVSMTKEGFEVLKTLV